MEHEERLFKPLVNFAAFTKLEMQIFMFLFYCMSSNAWVVYHRIVQAHYPKRPKTKLTFESELKRDGIEKIASRLRERGKRIPAFTTIQSTLNNLHDAGILSKRKVSGKIHYFISDNIISQINTYNLLNVPINYGTLGDFI